MPEGAVTPVSAKSSREPSVAPRRRRALPLALGFIALGFGLGSAYRGLDARTTLVIDLEADKGTTVELFYNELWTSSVRLQLKPGRTAYRFEGLPRRLFELRIDPTDADAAHVRVHGLSFWSGDSLLRTLAPAHLE